MLLSGTMTSDNFGLTPHQELLLEGFEATYKPTDSRLVAAADQAAGGLREQITDAFGLSLADDKEYYDVMVGLVAASGVMAKIIEMGLSPDVAANVVRTSLSVMRPKE